jgi:hypothetical protein
LPVQSKYHHRHYLDITQDLSVNADGCSFKVFKPSWYWWKLLAGCYWNIKLETRLFDVLCTPFIISFFIFYRRRRTGIKQTNHGT